MENKKPKYALVLSHNDEISGKMESALTEEKFKIVSATKVDEALLKISNQDFDFISVDMDSVGLQSRDLISNLRKKEAKKNIKDKSHVLVCGSAASMFNRYFTHFDNVKFCELPFNEGEYKAKVQSFSGKSDVIFDNTKTVAAGDYLILEGGNGQDMYWILDGEFEITKSSQGDEDVVIGKANPGELVGEMSFLDDLPRSASIKAKVDSEVLVIPQSKFADVLDKQPRWFRSLMKTLSQRLREANTRLTE